MFWQSCSGKIYHPCTIRLCDVMGVGCVTCVTWSDITRDIPWHHLHLPSHPSFPRMKLYSCSLSLIRIFTLWLSQNDTNQIQHHLNWASCQLSLPRFCIRAIHGSILSFQSSHTRTLGFWHVRTYIPSFMECLDIFVNDKNNQNILMMDSFLVS